MVDAAFRKPFGLTAGMIGLLQGIAWFALSLMGIFMYADVMEVPFPPKSDFGSVLSSAIAFLFEDGRNMGTLLSPADLLIWSVFYLFFSIIWICVSGFLLFVVLSNKTGRPCKVANTLWSCTTILICALDFSLTVALGISMGDVNKNFDNIESLQYLFIWIACGVLMTVAARGFVLWIVNLVIAIVLYKVDVDSFGSRPATNPNQIEPYNPNNPYAGMSGSNFQSPWTQMAATDYNKPANPYGNPGVPRSNGGNSNNSYDWDQGSGRNIPRLNPNAHLDYPNPNPVRVPTPDYPTSPVYGNRPKSAFKYPAPQRPPNMNRY